MTDTMLEFKTIIKNDMISIPDEYKNVFIAPAVVAVRISPLQPKKPREGWKEAFHKYPADAAPETLVPEILAEDKNFEWEW